MNRDGDVYLRPDEFLPERFLETPSGPFTSINDIHAFGFGRRFARMRLSCLTEAQISTGFA